jgi:hypothetical protein
MSQTKKQPWSATQQAATHDAAGLGSKVEVVCGRLEELQLDIKVDVLIRCCNAHVEDL